MQREYNVLFLCTGNRARSILAEGILRHKGRPNFRAYSAGSQPHGRVHPLALRELERAQMPTEGLRSKSWDEFAKPGAPRMDFVFTLCASAARETCPVWPGQPMTAHWGIPDPGKCGGKRGGTGASLPGRVYHTRPADRAFLELAIGEPR